MARNNEQKLIHLEKLNQMNIDLTEHLVTSISKADKRIKIIKQKTNLNDKENEDRTNFHFHD